MDTLFNLLGVAANIIQVGSFVFVLYLLWRTRRQLKQHLARLKEQTSARPMALAIGLGGNIEGAVRQHLETHQLNMPIENFFREGFIPQEQFSIILRELMRTRDRLTNLGVTEVHLFYRGPVTFAMALGALIYNWVPVKLYEYREGEYKLNFVLEKETVLGLAPETVTGSGDETLRGL